MVHSLPNSKTGQPVSDDIIEAELVSDSQVRWDEDSAIIIANTLDDTSGVDFGDPCNSCGAPRDTTVAFCASCGATISSVTRSMVAAGTSGSHQTALPDRVMQCKGCGAEVATSLDQRSFVCPFCDTAYVVELPLRDGRQRPEFIIGFSVTAEQAREKFFEWLGKNSWYRPGDLSRRAFAEKQPGVYLPFWHFATFAESSWTAQVGEYWYRTETYSVKDSQGRTQTRTRRVQETEWFPLSGHHHRYYYGFLVPATRGISLEESHEIQPFQLSALQRFRPFFLAGWMAEEYSIESREAARLSIEEFSRRQEREIAYFVPGDTHRNLQVHTKIEINESDLILLPVHVLSYRYRDRLYHFLVNGQSGKVFGQKPWSGTRIASLVTAVLLLLAAFILLMIYLSNK